MFKSVTLEMSLKPFKRTDDEYIRSVCREVFASWRQLIKNRETVSIMLWTADGSEILDYSGDPSEPFEWAYFMGTANLPEATEKDPAELSLHEKRRHYIPAPPTVTYGILKRIIEILKEEGRKACPNSVIRVGETFDIGPEFAISDFKYNRHTEICSGATLDKCGFVDSTSCLKSDTKKYAAYPNGIPEGLPFGTFLGKQAEVFCRDMGFDYLWLSNGLGFSANPWDKTGKIFDGKRFYPASVSVNDTVGPWIAKLHQIPEIVFSKASFDGEKGNLLFSLVTPYRMNPLEMRLACPDSCKVRVVASRYAGIRTSGSSFAPPVTHIQTGVPGYGENRNPEFIYNGNTSYYSIQVPPGGETFYYISFGGEIKLEDIELWCFGYEGRTREGIEEKSQLLTFNKSLPPQHPAGFPRAVKFEL